MLDITKLTFETRESLSFRMGYESVTPESLNRIKEMSPAQAFDEWTQWHGLINWGSSLRTQWDSLKAAEIAPPHDRKALRFVMNHKDLDSGAKPYGFSLTFRDGSILPVSFWFADRAARNAFASALLCDQVTIDQET